MIIKKGLFSNMCIPPDENGEFSAHFSGLCEVDGMITAKLINITDGSVTEKQVGKSDLGRMSGCICGLKKDCVYDITLSADSFLSHEEISVYDVRTDQNSRVVPVKLEKIFCELVKRKHYDDARYMWLRLRLIFGGDCIIEKITEETGFKVSAGVNYDNSIVEIRQKKNEVELYTKIQYFHLNNLHDVVVTYFAPSKDKALKTSDGRYVQMFTNVHMEKNHRRSPFVDYLHVSSPTEYLREWESLSVHDFEKIPFKQHYFAENICKIKNLYPMNEAEGKVFFFAFKLRSFKKMQYKLNIFHSGSLAVWCNNEKVYSKELKRTVVKAKPTKAKVTLIEGENEIIIAMKASYFKLSGQIEYLTGLGVYGECISSNDPLPYLICE